MARKSLSDMSGIASTIARSGAGTGDKRPRTGAPALGALQGSLAAIREIDPALIDDWGPVDRLDEFTAVNAEDDDDGFEALKASLRETGQQVPILVRRSKSDGRFEAIYGRRRLRACRELGLKVRANVQDLDDSTALLAKGLENAARRNLSFYEKARFAEAIQAAGHDSATVRQVLNLSASGLSHLVRVTQNIPRAGGDGIGSAPRSGRPKWTALADLFASGKVTEPVALDLLRRAGAMGSDDRLEFLLREAVKRGARPAGSTTETEVLEGVTVRSGRGGVSLTVRRSGDSAAFAAWLDDHLAEIIKQSYAAFTAVNAKDET